MAMEIISWKCGMTILVVAVVDGGVRGGGMAMGVLTNIVCGVVISSLMAMS